MCRPPSPTASRGPRSLVDTRGEYPRRATDVVLSQLTPVKVAFILGGFALLIPTVVMKHPHPSLSLPLRGFLAIPESGNCTFSGASVIGLELGEGLFDWIEV
jgi:hypothetical protein